MPNFSRLSDRNQMEGRGIVRGSGIWDLERHRVNQDQGNNLPWGEAVRRSVRPGNDFKVKLSGFIDFRVADGASVYVETGDTFPGLIKALRINRRA